MERKRLLLFTGILALTVALSGGLFVVLAAQEGTEDDPLITKSYIDDVFKPEMMDLIEEAVSALANTEITGIQSLIDSYETQINNKINEFYTSTGSVLDNQVYIDMLHEGIREKLNEIIVTPSSSSETFVFVSLNSGEKLIGQTGCEIIMRSGAAVCNAVSGVGLIDIPSSLELADSAPLQQNTLYMVTANGGGFTATENSTFLVRGSYEIE